MGLLVWNRRIVIAYLRLQTQQIPNWQFTGTSATLRIFSSQQFFENVTGELVPQGQVNNINTCYQEYACSVSGTTLTIPAVTLATTTDSTTPNAVYTAVIYSPQDVPLYYLLSQFYVDPYSLQIPAQSAVEVTEAGTASSIGIYTQRGISGGKNYYNLQGEDDAVTASSVYWNAGLGEWQITNAATSALYRGIEDTDYPWEVTSWTQANGDLPLPTVAEYTTVMSSTWEQLTIENQGTVPRVQPINEYLTATQTEQLINARIGTGTTPFAAELVAGKTELDVDPDLASRPIAIGINSPIILPLLTPVYLSTYGCNQTGLDAAIADIGSDNKQLVVTCACTVTTDTTIPDNILLEVWATGSFTIDNGVTLTIGSMAVQPSRQIFFGAGDAIFLESAVPYLDPTWWAGPSPLDKLVSNADHAFAQVVASVENGNGPVELGSNGWKVTDLVLPSDSIWNGAGNSTNASDGTVFILQNTAPTILIRGVLRVEEAYRNIVLNNFTISVGSSDQASCLVMTGSVPNSGINFQANNITFHGTATASAPQVYIRDFDGAHAWEAINNQFNHCQWATPEDTHSFHIDTVNSLTYFNGRQANNPTGSIFGYLEYAGWITDDTPDNRGVAGLTPTATLDRTIKVTISVGTKNATVTTGTVSLKDVGQQVVLDNGVFQEVNYITGITTATTFTVENNAAHTFTTSDCEVYRYSPDSNGAKAVWQLVNGHNTLQINNNTDEGYQYFLINDASDNLSPININGGIIQSLIQLNAACVMNVGGCRMYSQTFEDVSGIQATIGLAQTNSLSSTNLWGVTLLEPRLFGVNDGSTMIPVNFSYGYNGGTFSPFNRQFVGTPTWFFQDTNHAGGLDTPLVMFVAADVTTGGPHKALFGWGRTEPTSEVLDYYYVVKRDYDTGFTVMEGIQDLPNRGFQFNASLYADETFVGGAISATITTNEADWTPGGSQMFIRVTPSGADRTLSGLGLTGTSLSTMLDGEMHQIWNESTTRVLTLLHNTGSSDLNRFFSDTGQNVVLQPQQGADVWWDADCLTGRWRVSKKSLTGVYDTATELIIDNIVTVEQAFSATDTASITGQTTIGAGLDFNFDFNPSSAANGTATIGNPGSHVIQLNETTGVMDIVSTDIDISGSAQITGSLGVVGSSRVTGAGGFGYGTGVGSTVSQGTSRSTQVTINALCGTITLFSTAGSATPTTFKVNNSTVAATDVIVLSQKTGTDVYALNVNSVGAGAFYITVTDITGTTSEAPAISFAVIKAVAT